MDDQTYLIGDYVIEVWEGQHPIEHETCWKWRARYIGAPDGSIHTISTGHTDFQEDALHNVLRALAIESVTFHPDRELLEALAPGLEQYRFGKRRSPAPQETADA